MSSAFLCPFEADGHSQAELLMRPNSGPPASERHGCHYWSTFERVYITICCLYIYRAAFDCALGFLDRSFGSNGDVGHPGSLGFTFSLL
jgi:hypothetical protein